MNGVSLCAARRIGAAVPAGRDPYGSAQRQHRRHSRGSRRSYARTAGARRAAADRTRAAPPAVRVHQRRGARSRGVRTRTAPPRQPGPPAAHRADAVSAAGRAAGA